MTQFEVKQTTEAMTDTAENPQPGESVVLVIENKPVDATLMRFMLSESRQPSYKYLWSSNLRSALALLQKRSVDVVLASLDLPDARGLEVLKGLGQWTDHLPVVVVLRQAEEILGPAAVRHGAQDYLVKGQIATNLLLKTVRHAVQRKEMQIRQQRMAEQIQASLKHEGFSAMAGAIAHDFGNLLAVILGNSQICLSKVGDGSVIEENLKAIVKAAIRAGKLTDSMLAYTGNAHYRMEPCDLNDVVKHTVGLLGADQLPDHQFHVEMQEDLPAVVGDSDRLGDLLTGLLVNAMEALGEKTGKITVETARPKENEVALCVTDTGCGMSEETLKRACEPFFTTKLMGRGMGLATAMGNARAHNGKLEIQSALGQGTTVTVTLPAAQTAKQERKAHMQASRQSRVPGVLVVDDEPCVREVAEDLLSAGGYQVYTAGTGREALQVLRGSLKEIKAVILDIHLPDDDGRKVFHAIKSLSPGVGVLLSSGNGPESAAGLEGDPAYAGFLDKPFQLESILKRIGQVVEPPAGPSYQSEDSQSYEPLFEEDQDQSIFQQQWAAS